MYKNKSNFKVGTGSFRAGHFVFVNLKYIESYLTCSLYNSKSNVESDTGLISGK